MEVTSQIVFSSSASVGFELMLGEDEKCLSNGIVYGTTESHESNMGVLNKALKVQLQGTKELWNLPPFPSWDDVEVEGLDGNEKELDPDEQDEIKERRRRKRKRKPKKVHLVIITHGLHSNIGADMLFMKEAIDEEYKKGEIAWREKMAKAGEDADREKEEDRELVIVRGFHDNVCRTERGIKYLGRRLARFTLQLVNPGLPEPFIPPPPKLRKTRKNHHHPHLAIPPTIDDYDSTPPFEVTSISFIGHSLGGLVQTYAIAYIHAHHPDFFIHHKPVNFVTLATPFLGLSNENPIYVKFALDFGLVGRTGQDLGLTWRAPFPTFTKPSTAGEADTSKPLLRILPKGPAHDVLKMFRNRTLYANVVNDGIVPLRTSCLLFLDWQGLGKVEKARRENGAVGGLVEWGWGQLTSSGTGRSGSPRAGVSGAGPAALASPTNTWFSSKKTGEQLQKEEENPISQAPKTGEPTQREVETSSEDAESTEQNSAAPNAFTSLLSLFRLTASPTGSSKKRVKDPPKIYRRSQTIKSEPTVKSESADPSAPPSPIMTTATAPDLGASPFLLAPPRTSILEAAGDVLNPPLPPTTFIISPSSRPRTIFHDRIYTSSDIPPPPPSPEAHKVEEKIARAYHEDISWRKVLVRLEPDAHNNMVVRRMFPNAYGWPVVQHLCETHFGESPAALTPDDVESKRDNAQATTTAAVDEQAQEEEPASAFDDTMTFTSDSGKWSDRAFVISDDDGDDDNDNDQGETYNSHNNYHRPARRVPEISKLLTTSTTPSPPQHQQHHKSPCLGATVAKVQVHAPSTSTAAARFISDAEVVDSPTSIVPLVGLPRSEAVRILERHVGGVATTKDSPGEGGEGAQAQAQTQAQTQGVVERVARLSLG